MSVSRNKLALLEFYPILVSVFIWPEKLRNKRIQIKCDNLVTVYIINKLKSQDLVIMKPMRIFSLQCLQHNIWFQATHIAVYHNIDSDLLTRGQVHKFHTGR